MVQYQIVHKQHGPYKQDPSSNLIPKEKEKKKKGKYINQKCYFHAKNRQKIKYTCAHHEKSDRFTIRSVV